MKLCPHPGSSNGEVGESWGELETVGGTTLDEDWRLLQRIWSTWYIYIIYKHFLIFIIIINIVIIDKMIIQPGICIGSDCWGRVVTVTSMSARSSSLFLKSFQIVFNEIFNWFLRKIVFFLNLCPMCWNVLKENWGPIHSLLAGPMWVTISTWGRCERW